MKIINKLIKNESGSITLKVALVAGAVLILGLILLEYYSIFTLQDNIHTHLERTVNMAVEGSMLDNYRQEHISRIDSASAEILVYQYIQEEMGLDSNYSASNYKIKINDLSIQEEPPIVEINVSVDYIPLYLKNLVDTGFEFNIKAKSRNRRSE